MKTRTTRTRRLLAAATLAALPLFAGAGQPGPHRTADDADRTRHFTERPGGPRALYWAGVDAETASFVYAVSGSDAGGRVFGFLVSL